MIKSITFEGKTHYLNEQDKKLISVSSINKTFGDVKFMNIPSSILEQARTNGEMIHYGLVEALNGGYVVDSAKTILKWFKDNNKEIVELEKLVYDNNFVGYIDVMCEDCFVELKTRSTDTLDLTTVLQCEVYKRLTNKDYHILNYNRKTFKLKELKPKNEDIEKCKQFIDMFVKVQNKYNEIF